jgi:hypothetical protein
VTASITNEAVDELGLKAGGQATAVIKASDVMVAIELARVDKQSKENRPAVNGVVLNHQLLACS